MASAQNSTTSNDSFMIYTSENRAKHKPRVLKEQNLFLKKLTSIDDKLGDQNAR